MGYMTIEEKIAAFASSGRSHIGQEELAEYLGITLEELDEYAKAAGVRPVEYDADGWLPCGWGNCNRHSTVRGYNPESNTDHFLCEFHFASWLIGKEENGDDPEDKFQFSFRGHSIDMRPKLP